MSMPLFHWRPLLHLGARVGVCVLGLALASCATTPNTASDAPVSSGTIWFAMSKTDQGNTVLDPIGQVKDGRMVEVPDGCFENDKEYKRFAAQYLAAGESYWVAFRGEQAGRAVLLKKSPAWEDGVVARYEGPILLREKTMALASNQRGLENDADLTLAPTHEQEQMAVEAAKLEFTKAGLPPPLLSEVSADQLEIESLARGKTSLWIGVFSAEAEDRSGAVDSLFLIAIRKGKQLVPEFTWSKISSSEKDNAIPEFVDEGDLFGNGQQEMVLRISYYKGYKYLVLGHSKNGSRWEKMFETDALGCE